MNVPYAPAAHPNLAAWMKRMRGLDIVKGDVARARAWMGDLAGQNIERVKIFWRGDRIEWMLASGQHKWFMNEIESGRTIWPGLGIPAPEAKPGA